MNLRIDFEEDLANAISGYFAANGVTFEADATASELAMLYFEMRERSIQRLPREVFISDETHHALGALVKEPDANHQAAALEAWHATWHLRHLLTTGGDVVPHLSRSVKDSGFSDGLLWDYAMHHFHLTRQIDPSGFVTRSDYLLFSIVADDAAYFVNVVKHRDPQNLLWVRQNLVGIVAANFPELIEARVLPGVSGDTLTDEEKKELRRKNINTVIQVGADAVGPLGWGMTGDGHSLYCRLRADYLLRLIEAAEESMLGNAEGISSDCASAGIDVSNGVRIKLALLDSLDYSDELRRFLPTKDNIFGRIARQGFAITEASTTRPLL